MVPSFTYRAEVLEVIDADTLRLRVDLGFRCHVVIDGRVRGINAPELKTPEGVEAQKYIIDQIGGLPVTIQSYRDRRSFARWIVDVWLADERGLADVIREWMEAHPNTSE